MFVFVKGFLQIIFFMKHYEAMKISSYIINIYKNMITDIRTAWKFYNIGGSLLTNIYCAVLNIIGNSWHFVDMLRYFTDFRSAKIFKSKWFSWSNWVALLIVTTNKTIVKAVIILTQNLIYCFMHNGRVIS